MITQKYKPRVPDILFNNVYFTQPLGISKPFPVDDVLENLYSSLQIPYLMIDDPKNEVFVRMKKIVDDNNSDIKVDAFIFCMKYYEPFKC